MPENREEWKGSLKSIQRQFQALQAAIESYRNAVRHDSSLLEETLRLRDIENAILGLEDAYVVRLFAEFEACL